MEKQTFTVGRNEGKKDIRTAFIFSCPGQEELKSGLLVNGQTGKNLDMMLTFLNAKRPDIFPSVNRYDYRITNSSEIVHYKAHDQRTEPSVSEINNEKNIERLKNDISGYDYVITFGRCSAIAADNLKQRGVCKETVFLYSRHLSFLCLNSSINTDVHGNPIERGCENATAKRLEAAAEMILQQLS